MRIDIWSRYCVPLLLRGQSVTWNGRSPSLSTVTRLRWCGIVLSWTRRLRSIPAGSLPEMIAGKYQMSLEQAIAEPGS